MKVYESLKIGRELLKLMSEHDVQRDDWRFVPMYEEFRQMRENGMKYAEAIRNMEMEDTATEKMRHVSMRSVDDVTEILKANDVVVPDECRFDAWYLYMMTIADYPKTLTTDKQRASYVEETICDPDGDPTNVLACFAAKMCNAGVPIHWEMYI